PLASHRCKPLDLTASVPPKVVAEQFGKSVRCSDSMFIYARCCLCKSGGDEVGSGSDGPYFVRTVSVTIGIQL
ncbi:MAG TPA: hypothetical protein VNO32_04670, partial [Candidatus Acidoferrum sp.]|nr:hypothetical protein [Candidatus Acidoferrum sp.]